MKSWFQLEQYARSAAGKIHWKVGYLAIFVTNWYDSSMCMKHISDIFFHQRLFGFTKSYRLCRE